MATKKTPPPRSPPKAEAGDSAPGQHRPVDALVHKADERLFIPSREEAGQEADALAGAPTTKAVPLNPVTQRPHSLSSGSCHHNRWTIEPNFVASQVFFCGSDQDEFDKFKRGLAMLAAASTKAKAERTLKLEIDDEAFARVYGHRSHPIAAEKGRRVAVRVISQFGEESTKVLSL